MLSAIDQSGKMPSVWRSPGTSATGAATVTPAVRAEAASKILSSSRVWPWPARPASPTISPSRATSSAPPAWPAGRACTITGPPTRAAASVRAGAWPAAPPMVATSRSRSKLAAASLATTLPSRMTTMRSAVPRTSPSRCEIRMQLCPSATLRRTKARSWPAAWASSEEVGSSRMTSCSGSSVTVKARATSTICRRPIERSPTTSPGSMPWPGKIASSLSPISADARLVQPNPFSAKWLMRVFSATVRFGQSESSWKTQRMPWRWARCTE